MPSVKLKYGVAGATSQTFATPLAVKGFDPCDHFRPWPGILQVGMDGSRSVITKGFTRVFTVELGVITYNERKFLNAFLLSDETYITYDLQTTNLRVELENAEQWENDWLEGREFRYVKLVLVDKYLSNSFVAVNVFNDDIMYLKRHVKIEGTEASPETFTTNAGKLATDETAQNYPAFSDTTHVFHVEVNGTPYQDAKIHIITQPSISGGNLTWTAAVSGSGNASGDGFFYADLAIFLQAKP